MKKLFYLAALTALSLGLTACSDDDENGGADQQQCSQRYVLEFLNTEDTTECRYIEEAYQKATGSTSAQHDRQLVTVEAKDSLTCLAQFQTLMQQAEQALSGKNFQTVTCVTGYTSGRDSIYAHGYGALENYTYRTEVEGFTRSTIWGYQAYDVSHEGKHCVSLAMLWTETYGNSSSSFYLSSVEFDYYNWLTMELSDLSIGFGDIGGKCILACYPASDVTSRSKDITDVCILDNGDSDDHPSTLTYDGRNYLVIDHNLNKGFGGNHLYICYTHDPYDNRYLADRQNTCYRHKYLWKQWIHNVWLDISKDDVQGVMDDYTKQGYTPKIVPMIYTTPGSDHYMKEWEEANLHQGCSKGPAMLWIVGYKHY